MGPRHLSGGRPPHQGSVYRHQKKGSLVPETTRTELTPNQTGRTSTGLNGTELPYLNLIVKAATRPSFQSH